ncbi:MAG: hemerythrin domain-containing protein [Myxococcaceae bacterium]
MSAASTPGPNPRDLLIADHELLEKTFQEVEYAAKARDRDGLRDAWTRLENLLFAHMAAEEMHVFPSFEKVDPSETMALRNEHATLRKQLCELGVGVDLHLVASPLVAQFMSTLRQHAKREDTLAYRWAAANLSPELRNALALELARPDRATRR